MNIKNRLINDTTPWHSEPYVWLIITFPMLAIIGSMITIWLAIDSDDGLVVDDYYKKGLEINRTLDRDKAATNYGLKARISIDNNAGLLNITLDANDEFFYPEQLKIKLMHATQKNHDQILVVNKLNEKTYQIIISKLVKGRWYIQIESGDWRLLKYIFID